LCDIKVPQRTSLPVKQFDGTHLEYADDSFDMVLFSYVLHHAADDTLQLLRDAKRIARRYVAITEDPKETPDDFYWAYKHDRAGTFRGRREWLELFELMGFSVVHEEPLDPHIHSRHFYLLGVA
jgi:SAM-dependent methyltransferase